MGKQDLSWHPAAAHLVGATFTGCIFNTPNALGHGGPSQDLAAV